MALEGPRRFGIRLTVGGDALRVSVSGEVDLSVADELSHVLDGLPPQDHVVIDFADVTFCDSSGIRAMIELRNFQFAAGHTLSLVNTRAEVRHVFALSGLVALLGMPDVAPASTRSGKPQAA
jgi:anti-anti-sigma factor